MEGDERRAGDQSGAESQEERAGGIPRNPRKDVGGSNFHGGANRELLPIAASVVQPILDQDAELSGGLEGGEDAPYGDVRESSEDGERQLGCDVRGYPYR